MGKTGLRRKLVKRIVSAAGKAVMAKSERLVPQRDFIVDPRHKLRKLDADVLSDHEIGDKRGGKRDQDSQDTIEDF